jgi:acyl carrier protein
MPAEISVTELAGLIVDSLGIQGVDPLGLSPDTPFFGDDGLGIDSLDLLEVSMMLNKVYGVKIRSDDPELHEIFSSIGRLATHVSANRVK